MIFRQTMIFFNNTPTKVYSPIYSNNKQIGFDIIIFDITGMLRTRTHVSKITSLKCEENC